MSGEPLGKEPLSYYFDHLLEKSKFPNLRYEKENIVLVTFEEHNKKTMGFPLHKHKELIEGAKNKFIK